MSVIALVNTRIFGGAADLTGSSNAVELNAEVDGLDATTFGGLGWRQRAGGLSDANGNVGGFFDAGDPSKPDDRLWADLAKANPWTFAPDGAAIGQLAYLTRMVQKNYKPGASVGELLGYTADLVGDEPLARGSVLHDAGTARTTTGTGTIVQLGAVGVGMKMWCTLHVLSVAGTTPSITVKLQSATTGAFSSPTDRATFAAATAVGGQWVGTAAGPITDTYWRLSWTISGTAPSFLLLAAAGLGAAQ